MHVPCSNSYILIANVTLKFYCHSGNMYRQAEQWKEKLSGLDGGRLVKGPLTHNEFFLAKKDHSTSDANIICGNHSSNFLSQMGVNYLFPS